MKQLSVGLDHPLHVPDGADARLGVRRINPENRPLADAELIQLPRAVKSVHTDPFDLPVLFVRAVHSIQRTAVVAEKKRCCHHVFVDSDASGNPHKVPAKRFLALPSVAGAVKMGQ